jgi:hypothetical protein
MSRQKIIRIKEPVLQQDTLTSEARKFGGDTYENAARCDTDAAKRTRRFAALSARVRPGNLRSQR